MPATLFEMKTAAAAPTAWPRYPSLYEINTWVWLSDLSRRHKKALNLSSVPPQEWDAIAALGFDSVWLMGVWERSPMGTAIANRNASLLEDFRRSLPDYRAEDNVGSPYCIRRYTADRHLGGPDGLAAARRELARRGMKLILDFVPNHVAPDHPWVATHPEYFIRGNAEEPSKDPPSSMEIGGTVFACGRDPYFPSWPDVLQLNAFEAGLRRAVIATLSELSDQCDGVRCDMAMLALNDIFQRTWGSRAGALPLTEYWADVIAAIKDRHRGFLFIAEAYWDLEWRLQQLGFDFCYDKTLYDRLEHGEAENIRLHLCAEPAYQEKLVRFIENHDEPRAAAAFMPAKQKAAALVAATLPGLRLFHEGQFEGRRIRPSVFLGRRAEEPPDDELSEFYRRLLQLMNRPLFRQGDWKLCERTGWPDNASFLNLLAWSWRNAGEQYLIVINFSAERAQARVQVPWASAGGQTWRLTDLLSGADFERDGDEMTLPGLYVDLAPWNYHFFQCVPE